MKQVIEIYGKFLLEAVSVAALVLFLLTGIHDSEGNRGIFQMIGAELPVGSFADENYIDSEIYGQESRKKMPVIRFETEDIIKKGKQKLSDYIIAEDYAANRLAIRILCIKDPEQMDITGDYKGDTTEILFPEAGIYTVTVEAKDDANRKSVNVIKIPVNE